VLVLLATSDTDQINQLRTGGAFNWSLAIQGSILVSAGINVLAISILDLRKRRNAESVLLALWIFGVFVFAGVMNWSVNGRSILPMAPAAAIVLVRRMEDTRAFERSWAVRWALPGAILASMAFSMLMAWADHSLARASRHAAQSICAKYGHAPRGVMFQGHWGFQYYVQQCGARHFEFLKTPLLEGDLVAVPIYNTNVMWLDAEVATEIDRFDIPTLPWLSVMNRAAGAGFYADAGGPLPFVFGSIPVEEYHIMRIDAPFDPADYANLAPATAPAR
jgi:hypothetical protein